MLIILSFMMFGTIVGIGSVSAKPDLSPENEEMFSQNNIFGYEPCNSDTSSQALDSEISISGDTAEEKVWSGLASFLSSEQAAGIMGNIAQEDGNYNPLRREVGQSGKLYDESVQMGIGLVQWSFERRVDLLNYVKGRDASLTQYFEDDSLAQMSGDELIKKLGDSIVNKIYQVEIEYLKSDIDKSYKGYYEQTVPEDAAVWFEVNFERAGVPNIEYRKTKAREAYEKYAISDDESDDDEDDSDDDPDESDDGEGETYDSSSISGGAKAISDTAAKLAWPKGTDKKKFHMESGEGRTEAYKQAVEELGLKGHGHTHQPDCGDFVETVVKYSGYDKKYGKTNSYIQKHPDLWEFIEWDDGDTSKLRAGDIVYGKGRNSGTGQHWWVVTEIDGKLYRAEASYSHDNWGRITKEVKGKWKKYTHQWIYRAKGGGSSTPSCDSNSSGSLNINGTAVSLAWPYGTEKSKTEYPNGSPTPAFDEAHKKKTPGSSDAAAAAGASCDMFVSTVVRHAGYDRTYPLGNVDNQLNHVQTHPDLYEIQTWSGDKNDVRAGDIVIDGCGSNGCTHTYIIVEDEKNDLYIAEASHGQYFGRIDSFRSPNNTAYRIRTTGKTNNTNMGVSVTSGVSTSSASGTISSGSSQNNGDIGSSAFYFAWPESESEKRIKPESKDAWYKMVEENLGHPPNNRVEEGVSSVVFVWGVLRHAGLIDNFKINDRLDEQLENDSNWSKVAEGEINEDVLQDGDVLIRRCSEDSNSNYPCHYGIYAKKDGEGYTIEATDKSECDSDSSCDYKYPQVTKRLEHFNEAWRNTNNRSSGSVSSNNECDVCSGENSSGSNDGSIQEGGFKTKEEAKKIIDAYIRANLSKIDHMGSNCGGNYHKNCVNFSKWFIHTYLGMSIDFNGNGGDIATNFYTKNIRNYPDLKESDTPVAYSIFSVRQGPLTSSLEGHTGVILGINGDQVIWGEAGWCTSLGEVHTAPIETFQSHKDHKYIDVNAYLKGGL